MKKRFRSFELVSGIILTAAITAGLILKQQVSPFSLVELFLFAPGLFVIYYSFKPRKLTKWHGLIGGWLVIVCSILLYLSPYGLVGILYVYFIIFGIYLVVDYVESQGGFHKIFFDRCDMLKESYRKSKTQFLAIAAFFALWFTAVYFYTRQAFGSEVTAFFAALITLLLLIYTAFLLLEYLCRKRR
jgi:hypothetical protein